MMKDIDFDELDRAVNSLMNSVPQDDDDNTDQDASVAAIDEPASNMHDEIQLAPPAELMVVEEASEEAETEAPKIEPIQAPGASQSPSPATSLPTVRRGKFMDMVRPPIQEAAKSAPSAQPSRRGPTLQPVTSMRPTAQVPKPSLPEEDTVMTGWPVEPPTKSEPQETEVAPGSSSQSFEPLAPTPMPEAGLPVLPFLPDAKVEKRPLGRPAEVPVTPSVPDAVLPIAPSVDVVDSVGSAGGASLSDITDNDEDAQLPGQPLPAELGSELLSIETSTDMLPDSPAVMPNKPAQPASHSLHIPGVARGAAVASIPQQYKVQPKEESADPEPAGAMYDTAGYHQPLVHPTKKKPGWLWVVAIIVILLLGAAGGAAVYYFGLKG